jgi:hypothetical protein
MLAAAEAATNAAQNPPLDVSNTSQFRDLANSSRRIFGWNSKASLQIFNQVVISPEQLDQIRALKAEMTSEEEESISRRLNTSEGREKLNRLDRELREPAQNMEPQRFPRRHLARNLRSEDKGRW